VNYAKGGPVTGPSVPIRIERIGQGVDGMCIYSVNGQAPKSLLRRMNSDALRALLDKGAL